MQANCGDTDSPRVLTMQVTMRGRSPDLQGAHGGCGQALRPPGDPAPEDGRTSPAP